MPTGSTTVVDGLGWPECPRWRESRLWFVDMRQQAVFRLAADGTPERVCEIDDIPGGIDWLPDGSLLVVSMTKHQLLRFADGELSLYADLGGLMSDVANDLVIDSRGFCYVSNLGGAYAAIDSGTVPDPVPLVVVPPDRIPRQTQAVAVTPNGMVIDPDGRFIVAEPLAGALKVFSIAADGELLDGRRFADLGVGTMPDGIGVDPRGNVWAASPSTREVILARGGGEIASRIPWPADDPMPVACVVGGADGAELFVCLGDVGPDIHGEPTPHTGPYHGRIDMIRIDVDTNSVDTTSAGRRT